jgi:hypothetical protein
MTTTRFELTVQPNLVTVDCLDGTGYKTGLAYDGNNAVLKIGNVSIAFDGRNNWRGEDGHSGLVLQLQELTDDPVRLNNQSVRADSNSLAETIMRAIADDLGFTVSLG